ncbi:berberine bridge enzyme-like 21 [Salvia splendens]|uniref:berberine bridge enzyme-like 21 n=1 Tax=Salvia splendens TaxID=180675 RepID=UPI0011037532|nr:berberine bridge enzyme-like 21 [Salvia splendens]
MTRFSLLIILLTLTITHTTAQNVYDSFAQCFSDTKIPESEITTTLYSPNSPLFPTLLQSYIRNRRFNLSSTPKPTTIITPTSDLQVAAAVSCAKRLNVLLKIRSGGHDYEGLSYVSATPFVVLDMFNFRSVEIDAAADSAWVGAGAYLGELYFRISEQSRVRAFPGGVCPTVAAGGHISGAGYGTMMRKHGLSVDHMVDAKIAVADGRILDRSSMGEDLFWAIRGGGGASFGVIISYKIKLVPVPVTVTVFRLEKYEADNATDVFGQYQNFADTTEDDLFVRALLQPVTRSKKRSVRATFIGLYLGRADELLPITDSDFPKLGLKKSDCREMSWIESVLFWGNFDNKTSPSVLLNRTPDSVNFLKRKSDYVKKAISISDLETIFNKIVEIGKVGLVFNPYGGRMAEIPESSTPFPHRAGNKFKIQYSVNWDEEGEAADKDYVEQIREMYGFMAPYVSENPREAYLNYRDLDIGTTDNGENSYDDGKVYGVKYFKGNFDRLVKVKTAVDPDNFFRNEQSIPVLPFRGGRKGGK